jgi:thiol-disulfide isomerase/thioredoxin
MKRIISVLLSLASITAFGQTVTNFSAVNVINGKKFSLSDAASSKGAVVVFISNTCPYDEYYYDRLTKLAAEYSGKIPFVFINPNIGDEESTEAMKAKASAQQITVPYLADKDQAIMRLLRATRTPEAFVLQTNGNQFKVFYYGAIDDNAQVASDVHEHYLREAIDALLASRTPAPKPIRPTGCNINQK